MYAVLPTRRATSQSLKQDRDSKNAIESGILRAGIGSRSFSMPVECTGRQVTITKPLRTLAEEGIERIPRILGKITSAHVVLTAEKYRQIAEVTVKTRACTLVALCESSASMETALRDSLAKAESQAARFKDRLRT